jgi:hypothetical protein
MNASIHHYSAARLQTNQLLDPGRHMLSTVALVPGFVSFILLDFGAGHLASVCICEDPQTLELVDGLVLTWMRDKTGAVTIAGQAVSGELVLQRGL